MADEYIRKQDAVEALDGKIIVTGREKAERFQKAVYFFIGFSIFVFILCGISIMN